MTHSTTIKTRGYRKLLIYLGVACYAILWHYFTLVAPPELFTVNEVSAITEAHIAQHMPEQAFPPTEFYYSTRLPDDWHSSNRTHNDYWYRLNYRALPSQLDIARAWSVYVPAVTHNMVIYLNGKWIGQTGQFTRPTPRYHNAPQIFHFDASLLNHTNNQLDIRVAAGHHSQGLLSAIYVAPTHLLMKEHRFKHFIRVTLVEWMTLCMTLLAFISLVFFLYRPKDKIYGVFAIELALWSLHNLNLLMHQIPISTKLWEAFTMATLVWTVITMVLFNHRYFNERIYWVERFLWGFAISAFLLFIFPSNGLVLSLGYAIWDSVLVILGVYAISFLLHHFHHKPDLDTLLMILSGFPILAFGLHDILVVNHYLDKQDGLIIQYSCVPALLLFSWFIVRRFVNSLRTAEDLALNLEMRVHQREQEIEQQFFQLQKLRSEQILSDERVRIMRDMHDGIGSQLVAIVSSLLPSSDAKLIDVRERIKLCINDLRLVIDSLDPTLNDIGVLLGTLRARLEGQLKTAGIALNWDIQTLPEWAHNTPQENLHILRLLQEAITNAIKHSQCTHITLRAYSDPSYDDTVHIEIIDNGIGFQGTTSKRSGYGLENMRHRAKQIGADFCIENTGHGTRCRLALKMPKTALKKTSTYA